MIYDGYRFLEEGTNYKFTDGPSWDTNWGDTGADGVLDPGGDDIAITEGEGLYRLNVDLNALTFTATKTDWAIIGDATPNGWDNDTDMNYDATTGLYTIDIDLTGGANVKFRANDTWDIDLGDDNGDGKLGYGEGDIVVAESGNYTVTLDLTTPRYTYILSKN